MSTYVEKAIMQVSDQSTGPVKAINKELNKLFATSKKLSHSFGKIKVDVSGIVKATREISKFAASMKTVSTKPIKVRVDTSDIARAKREVAALNTRPRTTASGGSSKSTGATTLNGALFGRQAGNAFAASAKSNNIGHQIGVTFWAFVKYNLASLATNTVVDATGKGIKQQEGANTSMTAIAASSAERAIVNDLAERMSRQNPSYNKAQIKNLAAQVIPSSKNPQDIAGLTEISIKAANEALLAGKTPEQAVADAQLLPRILDSIGRLRDAQGNFDPVTANKYADIILQEMRSGGIDQSLEKAATTVRGSRSLGTALTEEGLRRILIGSEDTGTGFGNMANMFVKQLGDNTLERVREAQAAIGIRDGKNGEVKEVDLAAENPGQWIQQVLVPLLKKSGVDPADPANRSKLTQVLDNLVGRATTQDFISKLITSEQEYVARRDRALGTTDDFGRVKKPGYDTSLAFQEQALADNMPAQLAALGSQLTQVLGEVVGAFRDVLLPALKGMTSFAQMASDFIVGPDGKPTVGGATALVGGAAATGFGAVKLLGLLSGLGPNTTATQINTAALGRLTGALNANTLANGGSVIGGSAGKGWRGLLGKGALGLGIAALVGGATYMAGDGAGGDASNSDIAKNVAMTMGLTFGTEIVSLLGSAAIANPIGAAIAAAVALAIVNGRPKYGMGDQGLISGGNERNILGRAGVGTLEGGRHKQGLLAEDLGTSAAAARNIQNQMSGATAKIQSIMDGGTQKVEGAIQQLPAAGSGFGSNAGQVLSTFGGAFGAAAGAAISAAVANIRVNINSPQATARPAADTGIQSPN